LVRHDDGRHSWYVAFRLEREPETQALTEVDAVQELAGVPEFEAVMQAKKLGPMSLVGDRSVLERLVLAGNDDLLVKLPRTAVDGQLLLSAVHAPNAERVVPVLVQRHGANINFCGPNGMTPLLAAVLSAQPALVNACVALGANANAALDNGTCVLSHAIDKALPRRCALSTQTRSRRHASKTASRPSRWRAPARSPRASCWWPYSSSNGSW
jgi:hypothetical protein